LPLYDIKCLDCGNTDEIFLKLSEFDNLPICECGAMFTRVISPVNVQADIQPYKSMVTGEMITSRSQHRAHLKQHNCIEIGNEIPKPPQPKKRTAKEKEADMRHLYQVYDHLQSGGRYKADEKPLHYDSVTI